MDSARTGGLQKAMMSSAESHCGTHLIRSYRGLGILATEFVRQHDGAVWRPGQYAEYSKKRTCSVWNR